MRALSRLNRPVVAVAAVTILAGWLRIVHVSNPSDYVFDEVYYPKAACILVGWSNDTCTIDSSDEKYWRTTKWDVGSWVHPPLGKWEIAMGIKLFGMRSFGWRISSVIAGTLVVTLTAVMAQLLFGSALWTAVAGLLMAVENLNVVMSRVGLLDIHLEFWIVLAFVLFLLDRRWIDRRQADTEAAVAVRAEPDPDPPPDTAAALGAADAAAAADPGNDNEPVPPPPPAPSPIWRPWRFAAGAALGAASAVKWSGVFALFAVVVLAYMWETTRRHHARSWLRAFGRAVSRESFGIVLALLLTPIAIYMITWLPWFHHFAWSWHDWVANMGATWDFHHNGIQWTQLDPKTGLQTPTHPYYAHPGGWILLLRPISFYVNNVGTSTAQILAIGNPFIFWASVIALPYVLLAWRRTRDWRGGFIIVAFVGQYLPWFVQTRPTFFFYVLPLVPFMVLAVTWACRDLCDAKIVVREHDTGAVAVNPETGEAAISTAHVYRPFVVAYVVAVVVVFWLFWPILTAGRISDLHLRTIVWFRRWI
ncbi:MAG TPA: phospholipid carrier-dependent glycosyltransferase [Actinomycetota bacterium]|nr:phospholipid carrier-dependent glycosyltransferase [Actinomycetota bacterium]